MKVSFTNLIKAYSGKCDGLVYMYNRRLNKIIARRMPVFKPHAGNVRMGQVAKNLAALEICEAYRTDLRLYTEMFRMAYPEAGCYTWMNTFSKLMWALQRAFGLDLGSITRNEIETQELPCMTLKTAVEAGLLPIVKGYERFGSRMW